MAPSRRKKGGEEEEGVPDVEQDAKYEVGERVMAQYGNLESERFAATVVQVEYRERAC